MKFRPIFDRKKNRLRFRRFIEDAVFVFALLGFFTVFLDLGGVDSDWHPFFDFVYRTCLVFFLSFFLIRLFFSRFIFKNKRELWVTVGEIFFALMLLLSQCGLSWLQDIRSREFFQLAISIIFMVEISKRSLGLEKLKFNPPLLFVFSFLILIVIGAFALMLPISTHSGLGFLDAVFTSTSAVCVTGLVVVDTGTYFTHFGQNVILVLISLGGLGVMTFTSFFGLFFKGETSFRNQMIYKDFTGQGDLRNVFSTIVKIVTFTLSVELIGAIVLFFSLPESGAHGDWGERAYFSIFHAISAFNNAGFQLTANGLYDEALRHNYFFQTTTAFLIIFGGLGFAIAFNMVSYLKQSVRNRLRHLILFEPYRYEPWVLNFNSRIVLRTTGILLLAGMVILFFTEYNGALREHHGPGKFMAAFFCSVTPRTAGFNNIDMAMLSREGILVTMFLMWVGASPGSTGGGIKTSTIAVAVIAIVNIAKGRGNVEFAKREIATESLLRAFMIISISLLVLGLSTLAVTFFNPGLSMDKIVFECLSAFSTVGLSLGITPLLSDMGKVVIILTMFVGRVGAFTLLLGIVKKASGLKMYRYPVENVTIT